jgi:hypothetical protein
MTPAPYTPRRSRRNPIRKIENPVNREISETREKPDFLADNGGNSPLFHFCAVCKVCGRFSLRRQSSEASRGYHPIPRRVSAVPVSHIV